MKGSTNLHAISGVPPPPNFSLNSLLNPLRISLISQINPDLSCPAKHSNQLFKLFHCQ